MPITISIPDQITNAVNNSDLSESVKGPLTSLFTNNYVKSTYRYPADLGSNPARKHSIVFTIMTAMPATSAGDLAGTGQAWSSAGTDIASAAKTAYGGDWEKAGEDLKSAADKVTPALTPFLKTAVDRTTGSTIALYIPDNVNVTYSNNYDSDVSLSSALGKPYFLAQGAASLYNAFKDQGGAKLTNMTSTAASDPYARHILAAAAGKLTGTDLTRVAANQLGLAQNPQLQVMFRGVGFRQFQFDFVFTPYSEAESIHVQKIIQQFKMAAAPEITTNGAFSQGLFLKVPDTFKMDFYYGNQINTNVHKIGESVLTDINVDYSPNGWATFNDGSPTQIKMTLTFQETVIVDKTRISEGF